MAPRVRAVIFAPPDREAYVRSMREAELAHWRRVEAEQWSGPPTGIVQEGFRTLGLPADERTLLAAMDGYAGSIVGWSQLFPDTLVYTSDRMIDDISGAQSVGMRGIWRRNAETPLRGDITPDAVIDTLAEVPELVRRWNG